MTVDQWCSLGFLTVVLYFVGVSNWGWTSPADIWADIARKWGGHWGFGQQNPRSEDAEADEGPDVSSVSGHPLKEPLRTPQKLYGPLTGPQDIRDILHVDNASKMPTRYNYDSKSVKRQFGESGPAWVSRMLRLDILSRTELWAVGSKEFRVDERTVRRWIQKIEGPALKKEKVDTNENDDEDDNE